MNVRIIVIAGLLLATAQAHAQFWKSKRKQQPETAVQQPTSLNPSLPTQKKDYAPKESRKAAKGPTYGLEQEYYERVEAVAKERRKAEKMMAKPQYSDPMYFGHKRPPKKRKPSKMKFCKECGIRH